MLLRPRTRGDADDELFHDGEGIAFLKTLSNQIQELLHAHAIVEKIDRLLNAEPSLLASDDQPADCPA